MLSSVCHQAEAVKFLRRVVEGAITSPLILLGKEGTGRRFSVLAAMREVFCRGSKMPECSCASCYQIQKGRHPDVVTFAAGKKAITVDDVREILGEASIYPSSGPVRCFIIDGADNFTGKAAEDALLKTLEEPPARSRFFLIAEDKHLIPSTIMSRGVVVRYRSLPESFILSKVKELEKDPNKAVVYSRMGEGSLGIALQYCLGNKLVLRDMSYKTLGYAVDKDVQAMFNVIDTLNKSKELELGLLFMAQLLNDVLIGRLDPMRVTNRDLEKDLLTLGNRAPIKVWLELARRVSGIQEDSKYVHLNLAFQVKTALAESFI